MMQVLHRMRMRKFFPRQPLPDIQITPKEWKPDPEVSIEHDGLYAIAWECENEKPILDAENDNAMPPNSPKNAIQSDFLTEETLNTPTTTRERSREVFPPTEELCDVTKTHPYKEVDAESSSKQLNKSPANPGSSNYHLRHNPKPNCSDDCRF